jgi:hypothetical protein
MISVKVTKIWLFVKDKKRKKHSSQQKLYMQRIWPKGKKRNIKE